MNNQESINYLYNHYPSMNLNDFLPYQKNVLQRNLSNNCNFNKINPSYNGNVQQPIKYINTPNYLNSKKTNSAINLNKLNIHNNNQNQSQNQKQIKNKIPPNYISYSKLSSEPINSYFFSPLLPESNGKENNINISNLQLPKKSYTQKYSSSPLNYDKGNTMIAMQPKKISKKKKKMLILDLDETLVHSRFSPFDRKSDIILNINIDGRDHVIHVLKRPFVDHFLKEISKFYEILSFTASISQYASPLLDELDKEKIFNRRLFREHCTNYSGLYLKDLKQIGKDLKNMIIIDNNPASYALNQDNGIPILTWYDNINDNELNKLIPLLKYLSNVDDVRPIIKEIVDREKNEIKFDLVNKLIKNQNLFNPKNNNEQLNKFNNKYEISTYKNYDIESRDIKRIGNNGKDNIYKNYNGSNKINLNSKILYKYNDGIDSLSNMTYDEIQNEGHIENNNKENNNNGSDIIVNNYNNSKNSKSNNKNMSILNRTKELFNGINNNRQQYSEENNNNCLYTNNTNTNNKRSFTPNINVERRKNSYYNKDNLMINNQNNIHNIIYNIQDNNNKLNNEINDNNNNNNLNNKSPKDVLYNGNNNITKINNYLIKNNENNEDINNYLPKKNKTININTNMFKNYNSNKIKNNIPSNKNKNNFSSSNLNLNYNVPNRNNNNPHQPGFRLNYNSLNKNNAYRNTNTNQNNKKKINLTNYSNHNLEEENNKSIIDIRREKLNEIKKKMEEINNDIMKTDNHFYNTLKNFIPKNKIKDLNYKNNTNFLNQERNNNFKTKLNNYTTNNNLYNYNRSLSFNESVTDKNKDFKNVPQNNVYSNIENQNNIRTINTNDDIDFMNNKNNRIDTDINNVANAEQNRNLRSLIIDKNSNDYNNGFNINQNCFSNTFNSGFNNFINNMNNNFFKEKEEKNNSLNINYLNNNEEHPPLRKYNSININNYNMYNSLINNNRINYTINKRNIYQNNKVNNTNDYNGNNKISMNKSSTNFYPRMSINLD